MKFISVVLIFVFLCGCKPEATDTATVERQKTEQIMKDMQASVGMPAITNYQEKRWAKMIFELRDQADLVTYAYIVNMHGNLIYLGQCVGYGLPYSVQYTSPQKVAAKGHSYGYAILPQADPNGLYMPEGLSATWLMMLDTETKEIKPVYVEQELLVSPFKLHKDK